MRHESAVGSFNSHIIYAFPAHGLPCGLVVFVFANARMRRVKHSRGTNVLLEKIERAPRRPSTSLGFLHYRGPLVGEKAMPTPRGHGPGMCELDRWREQSLVI
jgi:hypothetical protein